MTEYIQVAPAEGDECIELPTEDDKTILVSTVAGQFPDTCGLKFKTAAGKMRGIRVANGRLHPPSSDGWGDTVYYCVFSNDGVSRFSSNSNTMLWISSLSSQSIPGRSKRMLDQSTSLYSCQSSLGRIKEKHEPNSSTNSSVFTSFLKKVELSRNTNSSSDSDYDNKIRKISTMILELKKAWKEKLIIDFIFKTYAELIFEKSHDLPKRSVKHCKTNLLKRKIGYFSYPNKKCNPELFQVLFGASIENEAIPLNMEDSKILETKLFEHVSEKAEEALESIAQVDELGFASYLKEGLVKPGSIFSDEQLYIISQSMKIKNAHDKCKKTAIQIIETLERLSNYRTIILPDANMAVIGSLKTQAEVVDKETRCFFAEVEQKILEDDEDVIEAAKILQEHLKEAFDKKMYDLAQLKTKRKEYDQVKGQKFNELVEEYKKLKQHLNTKTEMLAMLDKTDSPGNLSKSYIESDDDDD